MVALSDDFNRSNAALTTPWVQMTTGVTFNVVSNACAASSTSGQYADAYIYNSPLPQTQFAQIRIATIGSVGAFDLAGVVLRSANTANTALALYGTIWTAGWQIFTNVPGSVNSVTNLANGSGSYAAGSILRMEVSGSTVTLKYGGSTLGSYTGTLPTGSYTGIQMLYTSSVIDDWSAGDGSRNPITPMHAVMRASLY